MDDELVKKSNTLIQGRYRFGLNEQRVMLLLISKIKTVAKSGGIYRFPWSEITGKAARLTTKQRINGACEKLKSKTISIRKADQGDEEYFGCISGWRFTDEFIEFRLDSSMERELINLAGNFTIYHLQYALSLNSTYSIRIYEILKSEQYRAKDQPGAEKGAFVVIEVEALKSMLDIEENSLKTRFSNFKRIVLDKAQTDLEKNTDLKFTYKAVKNGKRFTHIKFFIKTNNRIQQSILPLSEIKSTTISNGDEFERKINGITYLGIAQDGFVEFMGHDSYRPVEMCRYADIEKMLEKGLVKRTKKGVVND